MGKETRFWEIDALRGVAVVMMIIFHLMFDLYYFKGFFVLIDSGFWLIFARLTLVTFLALAGVSLSLSYDRVKARLSQNSIIKKYLKRGLKIFGYGVLITIVTFMAFPENAIWFGVLHLIGLSIILAIPLLSKRRIALIVGIAFILLGVLLSAQTFSFPWLLWLGLAPQSFYTFDYVPLLPWFGVILLGLFAGSLLYEKRKPVKAPEAARPLCFLGRHSLLIYLTHQIVLVALLLFVF